MLGELTISHDSTTANAIPFVACLSRIWAIIGLAQYVVFEANAKVSDQMFCQLHDRPIRFVQ